MKCLTDIIIESLLDDEDILINDDSALNEQIAKLFNSNDFNKNFRPEACYVDDNLKSGGGITLKIVDKGCARGIPTGKMGDFDVLGDLPPNCLENEKEFGNYYNGSVDIKGSIDYWPSILKIAPVSFTYVYTSSQINPLSLPEYSLMFNSKSLKYLSGCTINCRMFMFTYDSAPADNVTINLKGNSKKIKHIYIHKDSKLKSWSNFNKIISNTKNITMVDTPLAHEIKQQYRTILTEDNPIAPFESSPQFLRAMKNFQELESITLDIGWEISKDRRGNWEIFRYDFNTKSKRKKI